MFAWLNRFRNCEKGIAAVELGLATPIFLLMFLSVTELGHMIYYSITIEKGMRSGVTYMARNNLGLLTTAEVDVIKQNTINLTTTGTMDGSGEFLVAGYETAMAVGDPVTIITKMVNVDVGTGSTTETASVMVVVLSVEVPYVPLLPVFTEEVMGNIGAIKLTHEQAIIGD